MFHPSPSDQKSGLVSSKKFHASFTTTSIPIPQGLDPHGELKNYMLAELDGGALVSTM
jgi:hypothetical protein